MTTTAERATSTTATSSGPASRRGQIPVVRAPLEIRKAKPEDSKLGFGVVFTDNIFMQEYDEGQGWHDARIEPYRALSLDPAAAVLHYAQAVFDGLKAFRGQDGKVRLFRPQKHAERLVNSCGRMCIPPPDAPAVLDSWLALVDLERAWVPRSVGTV